MIILTAAVVSAYTPPVGEYNVNFEGRVYYSDGTTPALSAMVKVYYPDTSSEPTFYSYTDDHGYYVVGGDFKGTEKYRIVASSNTYTVEEGGTVFEKGDHIKNDLIIPRTPPARIYGYVTRGGAPVSTHFYTSLNGYPIKDGIRYNQDIQSDATTGYYTSEPLFLTSPSTVSMIAYWQTPDTTIQSTEYEVNIQPSQEVRQDIIIPDHSVTFIVRTYNDGAPLGSVQYDFYYGPLSSGDGTDATGVRTRVSGFYSGETARVRATYNGNTIERSVTPGPDSTVNIDLYFGSMPTPTTVPATPTPTTAPATPTPPPSAFVIVPTPTARPATPTPAVAATTGGSSSTPETSAVPSVSPTTQAAPSSSPTAAGASLSPAASPTATSQPQANGSVPVSTDNGSSVNVLLYVLAGMGVMGVLVLIVGAAYLLMKKK